METVKFYGKNANNNMFADYAYIGSMMVSRDASRDELIRAGESIAGPIYGPMLCQFETEQNIVVLRV